MSNDYKNINNGKKQTPPKNESYKTTNPKVFTEIRKLMDDASEAYRKKKELENNSE